MAPRWTARDDAAVAAIAAARDRPGAGSAWPDAVAPDRGPLTGNQVKDRWRTIKHRFQASSDEAAAAAAAAPAPAPGARGPHRLTPIRDRAEAVGVEYQSTPAGQRDIVADPDASPAAAAEARRVIKRHKTAMHNFVSRAENRKPAQERYAALRRNLEHTRPIFVPQRRSEHTSSSLLLDSVYCTHPRGAPVLRSAG